MSKKSKNVLFTVYNEKTGFPVIVDGTRKQCAKAMNVTDNTFTENLCRFRKNNSGKWFFLERVVSEREYLLYK